MKNIIYLIIAVFALGHVSSCKDMSDIYQEFVVPNGLTYPQKPDSLKVYAGFNKLRITWLKAKDPNIVRAEIYWNNYTDTLKVNIPTDKDIIVTDITGLNENTYTFQVKTFDGDGNASIPAEVSGTAYGENYKLSVTDRTVASVLSDDNYNGIIRWNAGTVDLIYSEVRYKTSSGQTETFRVLPTETSSICYDAKPGELFEYRSVFLPPKGIDTVAKDWITYEYPFFLDREEILSDVVGKWEFDDPANLGKATVGNDLTAIGTGFAAIVGRAPDDGAVTVGMGSHYFCNHGIAANGGGTKVNEYTLEFVIKYAPAGYLTLYQTTVANNDDGEIFIRGNEGRIGIGSLGYSPEGSVPSNTWLRVILSVSANTYNFYVNGSLIHSSTLSADSRWAFDVNGVLLFADEDGEDAPIDVSEVAIWNRALTPLEVATLGGLN